MGKFIDLTGKKFGRLTVVKKVGKHQAETLWQCRCDCGNTCISDGVSLRRGHKKSCGCLKIESDHTPKGNVKDITGQKFGHLLVLKRWGSSKTGEALWECECDCGNPIHLILRGNALRSGHTQSCGCMRVSKGEYSIQKILVKNKISFKQFVRPFKYDNGHFAEFDFMIDDKYFIEFDGEQHYVNNYHGWNTEYLFESTHERDEIKNRWCEINHVPLIRIPYWHLKDMKIEDLVLNELNPFVIVNADNRVYSLSDIISENPSMISYSGKNVIISKYSLKGDYICTYTSKGAILNDLGSHNEKLVERIQKCCRGKSKSSSGFQWKFGQDKIKLDDIRHKTNLPILQIDKDTLQVIKEYDDSFDLDACGEFKYWYIKRVINDNNHTAKGYFWRYGE